MFNRDRAMYLFLLVFCYFFITATSNTISDDELPTSTVILSTPISDNSDTVSTISDDESTTPTVGSTLSNIGIDDLTTTATDELQPEESSTPDTEQTDIPIHSEGGCGMIQLSWLTASLMLTVGLIYC